MPRVALLHRFEMALAALLEHHTQRRVERRTLMYTYPAFAQKHPDWAASLFDLHFLTGHGADALMARDPEALAKAWTEQFRHQHLEQTERDVKLLTPIATDLLAMLTTTEMCADPDGSFTSGRGETAVVSNTLYPSAASITE